VQRPHEDGHHRLCVWVQGGWLGTRWVVKAAGFAGCCGCGRLGCVWRCAALCGLLCRCMLLILAEVGSFVKWLLVFVCRLLCCPRCWSGGSPPQRSVWQPTRRCRPLPRRQHLALTPRGCLCLQMCACALCAGEVWQQMGVAAQQQ
jgi:hypothetical protein